eukprot:364654-Chlamydomonas_euryale.AAC.12
MPRADICALICWMSVVLPEPAMPADCGGVGKGGKSSRCGGCRAGGWRRGHWREVREGGRGTEEQGGRVIGSWDLQWVIAWARERLGGQVDEWEGR